MWKYSIFVILLCIFLNSCFSTPCKMSMEVINKYNGNVEIEIKSNSVDNYLLNPLESIIRHNIDHYNGTILVKTENKLKFIAFGEYDHWFPMSHIISILIDNDEITININKMNIRLLANNYDEYEQYNDIK